VNFLRWVCIGLPEESPMLTEFECRQGAAFAPVIGKPYEGKPHVRFDEGAVEIGLWSA
jgi:hypothetical protein